MNETWIKSKIKMHIKKYNIKRYKYKCSSRKHISRGLKNPSNKILIIIYIENCKK